MSNLKCRTHKQRVMVLPHNNGSAGGNVVHRSDGAACTTDTVLVKIEGRNRGFLPSEIVAGVHRS